MKDPYYWLSEKHVVMVFLLLLAATLYIGAILTQQDKPLQTPKTPRGILEMESVWSSQRAGEVREAWGAQGIDSARKQVYLDFLFLVLYPVLVSFVCAWFAGGLSGKMAMYGVMVSWAVLLCAPLDAVENLAILKMLSGAIQQPFPAIATIAAGIKFSLLFGGFFYILVGGLVFVFTRLRAL